MLTVCVEELSESRDFLLSTTPMLWFAPMLLASSGEGENARLPRATADLKSGVTEYGAVSVYVRFTVVLSASGERRPSPMTIAVSDLGRLSDEDMTQKGSGAVSILPV